jgi:hypothetical protein
LVAFTVNVAPDCSPVAVKETNGEPSGLMAVTVNVIRLPGLPATLAGAMTTGGRLRQVTAMVVVADPVKAGDPEVAVKVTT